MEIKLNIPFEQLLRALAQLTPTQRRKAKAVLEQKSGGKATKVEGNFADLLLHGPVFSNEQLLRMQETRKAFTQWRDR
ncbi:MAG: hypothetical protein J5I62_06000 [Flavobacteriales bacterium]|jgi:hypothetical protein|nr:hypothetical protein [Flavobacteriales bacterium]MEB2341211.1 hypothetical protein [Flavobacteriia bacterium]